MSETVQIPKGWKNIKVFDIVESRLQGLFHSGGYKTEGIPLLRITDLDNKGNIKYGNIPKIETSQKNIDRFQLKKGDIVIARTGGAGRSAIVDRENYPLLFAAYLIRFRFKQEAFPQFINYFLRSGKTQNQFFGSIHGSSNKNINAQNVLDLDILLPPIPTQKKIVQKLDDILGQLEEKKKAILEILERQKKHQLLLSNNYLSHKTAELIPVENAPSHWELIKLGDTFDESDKKWLPNGKSELVNYIGLENIESNTGTLVRFSPTESSKIKSNKTIFTKNMVLYGKLRPYLNKVLLPTFDGICSTDILGLNLKSNIDRTFLAYFLRSWHVLSPVNRSVHGTKMPRTKIQVLQQIPIALPPIGEQKEIVKKIIQSDKTTSLIKKSIQEIQDKAEKSIQYQEHLQSSILDAAFSGKLVQ